MLDLGIWMALQSMVEMINHNQKQELNTLCNTVMKAWDELEMVKLSNVYERQKLILDLILKGNDSDKFIEAERGKLFKEPSREAEDLDEMPGCNVEMVNDELLTADNICPRDLRFLV